MGKTVGGALWLDPEKTSPFDFYQYWRNVDDADVIKCLKMLTFLPLEQIRQMESWEGAQLNKAKEILAYELTELVHGKEEAEKAQTTARSLFSGAADAANMPSVSVRESELDENGEIGVLSLMVKGKMISSNGEGRRLIKQGGVSLDDNKVTDAFMKVSAEQLKQGVVIKKGKKVFVKFTLD